jgi:hypothetical protein
LLVESHLLISVLLREFSRPILARSLFRLQKTKTLESRGDQLGTEVRFIFFDYLGAILIVFIPKKLHWIDFERFSQSLLDKVIENLSELRRPLAVKPAIDDSRIEIMPFLVHEAVPLDNGDAGLS